MKLSLFGISLLCLLAGSGCSTTSSAPTGIDDMPGSDHMARAPGVFDRHSPAGSGGLLVYSGSLIASDAAASDNHPTKSETASESTFQQFQTFQTYQRFLSLPATSKARRQFAQWQQWQRCESAE